MLFARAEALVLIRIDPEDGGCSGAIGGFFCETTWPAALGPGGIVERAPLAFTAIFCHLCSVLFLNTLPLQRNIRYPSLVGTDVPLQIIRFEEFVESVVLSVDLFRKHITVRWDVRVACEIDHLCENLFVSP